MRAVRTSRALAAIGVGLVLVVTGCSGEQGAAGGTGAGDAAEEVGPLGEYFEQMYPEESEADYDAQAREIEEITSSCMQEAGFDYTPMDPATDGASQDVVEDVVDYQSEEYVATNGYGMTTYDPEAPENQITEEYVDPNEDYVAAMSESEQTAFYEALHGPTPEFDESDPEAEMAEYDWTTAGCSGAAQHEVYGDQEAAYQDPAFTSLQEDMNRMYESTVQDPAVVELDAGWAACMADAGYPGYTAQQDAMDDISEQSSALYEGTTESSPEPDPAALEALQQVEIDTALADLRCKQEVDYDEQYLQISHDAEQEFVDTHRAELDAWVEAYGQGR